MNVVGEEDRISKLPDPLLHHILSFLPTECAVSTTVLSKRWKNVWVFVPVLDFRKWEPGRIIFTRYNDYDIQAITSETNKLMDFMDTLLVQRNMLSIKKFCISCDNAYFDHKRVNAWITTAMQCEVEEFIFSGCFSYRSNGKMIPDSLFTCASLTTLDFQFPVQYDLDLPESISLPRLKILRLKNIVYNNEELAGKLFSSSPELEELRLTGCSWENFRFIRVSAPKLKSFTLTRFLESYMEDCSGSNMDDLKVKIEAPNLMSFTFRGKLPEDFVVDSFPLLHDADLYYKRGDLESRFRPLDESRIHPLSKFVMKLCNVKVLKMSGAYFKILELAKVLPTCFPTFENLIHLEVYYICYLQMNTLLNFLDFSPNLESLVIGKVELSWHRDENALTFNIVPRCLECLKSIEIQKFNGWPREMKVVEFVLEHARFLQTVILETSYTAENYIDPRARHTRKNLIPEKVEALNKQILMQLGMSPWASTGCVIQFSSS